MEWNDYFEKLVNSTSDEFGIELAYTALQILNEALHHINESDKAFEAYETSSDSLDKHYLWMQITEHDSRAYGLIKAYGILTGHEFTTYKSNIEKEIHWLCDVFPSLDD